MKRHLWSVGFIASICMFGVPACAEVQTFEEALTQVYQTNPTLQAERAKLRETDEQVSQALSNWRPDIEATANAGVSNQGISDSSSAPIPSSSSGLTPRSAGFQITQPLFRGFRTVSATHAAEKQVAAERANLQLTEQKLFLDSGTAYLDVVHDEALVSLDRDNEAALRKELDATRERNKAGASGTTDVHQAESRVRRAEADRLKADGDLEKHRATYAHLVGDMPGTLQQPHLELENPSTLEETLNLAKKQNPGIEAASESFDEAKEETTLNEGSLLPEVDLVGTSQRQWDQSTFIPGRQDTLQVMVQVSMPLYKSGADYSRTRAAQQRETERRMQLEEARHQAYDDATSSWQSLLTARNTLVADRAEKDAAELALENVREEANVGTRTTLDVLNAEQELIDAKTGIVQADHDIAVAILHIRSATGILTAAALKLPVNLYDPDAHYQTARSQWIGFSDEEDDKATVSH
ncbi:TolC family outer membrane protein [Acidicapsa ligni]|uniref:TolC family outer membrane protein n=1 Tax=Acidicapsa ligni TaxID=542300 RepID=UPI0021E05B66|nr:TolC family outer membrane protein [Acidicapsa ligni]